MVLLSKQCKSKLRNKFRFRHLREIGQRQKLLAAYIDRVALNTGDHYSVSGTLLFSEFDTSGTFTFGLFDSVNNPASAIPEHTNQAGITDYTQSMSGILATSEKLGYRPLDSTFGFLATSNGGSREFFNYDETLPVPKNDNEFAFAMDLIKTASGFDVRVSLGGSNAQAETNETFNIATETLSEFDVLGFRFSSATGGTVTLSELQISTTGTPIPEPSAFGLLSGLATLLFCTSRRKRKASPGKA